MKGINILLLLLSLAFTTYGQINQHRRKIEPYVDTLTQTRIAADLTPAQFPGGMAKFYEYVSRKIRYPKDAKKLGIEGKVYVSFIVEKDGSIPSDSVKVVKGLFESCDMEAVRVIRASPDWIPGRSPDNQEAAPQRMILPITFKQ